MIHFDPSIGIKQAKILKMIAMSKCKPCHWDLQQESFPVDHKGQRVEYINGLHLTMAGPTDLVYVLSWHHYLQGNPEHKYRLSRHPHEEGLFYGNIQWQYRLGMATNIKDLVKLCNQIVW